MYYDLRGSGEPLLVFIHGLTCDHTDWVDQVAHFSDTHRCLSVDLAGHGRTPADGALTIERLGREVAELLASVEGDAVLIGHSMGCRVCMEAAYHLGARVAGIVFVDGSCFGRGDAEAIRDATLARIEDNGFVDVIDGLFAPMFTDNPPEPFRSRVVERARAMSPEYGPGLVADMAAWDAAHSDARIGALGMPVLAIQSTCVDSERRRTILAPGETTPWTDTLLEKVPGVEVEYMPGIGHFTMNEAPGAVNGRIARFLLERVAVATS